MRVRTTIFLAIVSILLGIVTFVLEQEPEAGADAAERANVLSRFPSSEVSRIAIEQGKDKVVLARQGSFWFFSEPEADRVDAGLVASLLDQLNHLSIVDEINEGEDSLTPVQLGVKGDEAIKIVLTGKTESGREIDERITIGVEAPRADTVYARRKSDSTVKVVAGNPRSLLEKPLEMLRDRQIVGAPSNLVVRLGIRSSTGELVLQRRVTPPVQPWALVQPINTWASPETLDELLAAFSGMKLKEVIREEASLEKIPNPLPDTSALVQMHLVGMEKPITIFLKEVEPPEIEGAPPLVEVRISDRPLVYRLHSDILSQLPSEPDELRDRTLARIPEAFLESIIVQSLIDPMVVLKSKRVGEGLAWDVRIHNKLLPANQSAVSDLVNGVSNAAILDFASDSGENLADFGLQPPARRVTFSLLLPGTPNDDGTPSQVQEVQRVLNLGWKQGDEQRLFANFEGEPFVYELDPTFVGLIPTHPIKWRSLSVLNVNSFHLSSITRELKDQEKLTLNYDYRRDRWEAFRNGVEVTPSLDVASARRLRDRVCSLTANGWYLSLASAYEALKDPSATFRIVTNELDPARGDSVEKTYTVKFAPSAANLYFGQVEGSPDVFFLDHETYRDLIRPVTSARMPGR